MNPHQNVYLPSSNFMAGVPGASTPQQSHQPQDDTKTDSNSSDDSAGQDLQGSFSESSQSLTPFNTGFNGDAVLLNTFSNPPMSFTGQPNNFSSVYFGNTLPSSENNQAFAAGNTLTGDTYRPMFDYKPSGSSPMSFLPQSGMQQYSDFDNINYFNSGVQQAHSVSEPTSPRQTIGQSSNVVNDVAQSEPSFSPQSFGDGPGQMDGSFDFAGSSAFSHQLTANDPFLGNNDGFVDTSSAGSSSFLPTDEQVTPAHDGSVASTSSASPLADDSKALVPYSAPPTLPHPSSSALSMHVPHGPTVTQTPRDYAEFPDKMFVPHDRLVTGDRTLPSLFPTRLAGYSGDLDLLWWRGVFGQHPWRLDQQQMSRMGKETVANGSGTAHRIIEVIGQIWGPEVREWYKTLPAGKRDGYLVPPAGWTPPTRVMWTVTKVQSEQLISVWNKTAAHWTSRLPIIRCDESAVIPWMGSMHPFVHLIGSIRRGGGGAGSSRVRKAPQGGLSATKVDRLVSHLRTKAGLSATHIADIIEKLRD